MKVLLTGGAGVVGSVLARHLLDAGHRVVILDTFEHGVESVLHLPPAVSLIRGSVSRGKELHTAAKSCDAVIHLAAVVGAPACAADPVLAAEVISEGTRRVCQ